MKMEMSALGWNFDVLCLRVDTKHKHPKDLRCEILGGSPKSFSYGEMLP